MSNSRAGALWRALRARSRYRDTRTQAVEAQLRADFRDEIIPALRSAYERLRYEGYEARLETDTLEAELAVTNFNQLELKYRVSGHVYRSPSFHLGALERDTGDGRIPRVEIEWGGRSRQFHPACCIRERLEPAIMRYYRRFLMDAPRASQ